MDYKTKRWEDLRSRVLRRDNYICQECKRYGRMRSGNHVHHIFPAEFYPDYQWKPWNLITLCRDCHNAMHDRDTHELSTKGEQLRCRTNQRIAQRDRKGSDGTTAE